MTPEDRLLDALLPGRQPLPGPPAPPARPTPYEQLHQAPPPAPPAPYDHLRQARAFIALALAQAREPVRTPASQRLQLHYLRAAVAELDQIDTLE